MTELVAAEGRNVCATGTVGLAALFLVLFQARDPAVPAAIALFEEIAPPERPLGR